MLPAGAHRKVPYRSNLAIVDVDFFASRTVALPVSYSMKKRLCDARCSSIASGCSRRASTSDPTRVNSSKGRSRYSPSTQRKSRGTFAQVLASCATRPRKISFAINSCFRNAWPTSCFGTRSNFSPSRCDPSSNPSRVNAQTVVHPSALPYPRSPRMTAACPPISRANCLSLVDDLALLLPGNINLSICSLVRYRHTAKNPHNSRSLSVSCRFRPALLSISIASITSPPSQAPSRPPNPVVGSGWPGRGAGVRTALSPGGRHRRNVLNWRGGTGSCIETVLARCLIVPTRNRSIDPSTEPCSHSGFEVLHHMLHDVDLYYAQAYNA